MGFWVVTLEIAIGLVIVVAFWGLIAWAARHVWHN